AEVEPNPNVGIVCANHRDARVLRRILHLVDERTVTQRLLGHVLRRRSVCYVPISSTHGSIASVDCLPHPRSAGNQMAAPTRNAGCRTIVASRDASVKQVVRKNERLGVAGPAATHAAPTGAGIGAVTNATVKSAAVIALEKAQTRPCANRINPRIEAVSANV